MDKPNDSRAETSGTVRSGHVSRIALVGVSTFRRPEGLKALLAGIAAQTFEATPAPRISVLVVDNACDPAIEKLVDALAAELRLSTRYVGEGRRGISQARNAILANVPENTDWLFLLDDDEVPRSNWMEQLIVGIERTGAEAVCGPVLAGRDIPYPGWVRDGRFFTAPRRKTFDNYADVSFGVMGNCVLSATFLRRHNIRFDERLGLVGSEDKVFFDSILSSGGRLSYTNEAIVDHYVDIDRATLRYLLRREFRVGCGRGLLLRYANPSGAAVALFLLRSAAKLLGDLILMPLNVVFRSFSANRFDRMKPMFDIAQSAGRIYGAIGIKYEQYAQQ